MSKIQSAERASGSARPAPPPEPLTTKARLLENLSAPKPTRRAPLGSLLTAAGRLHETGVRRGLAAQTEHPGERLGALLLAAGEIDADDLYRALGEQMGVAFVRLGEFDVEPAALAALPGDVARAQRVLPLMFHDARLVIATDDPTDTEKLSELRFRTQRSIEVVLATPADLDTAIATHYPLIEDAALDSRG